MGKGGKLGSEHEGPICKLVRAQGLELADMERH